MGAGSGKGETHFRPGGSTEVLGNTEVSDKGVLVCLLALGHAM